MKKIINKKLGTFYIDEFIDGLGITIQPETVGITIYDSDTKPLYYLPASLFEDMASYDEKLPKMEYDAIIRFLKTCETSGELAKRFANN